MDYKDSAADITYYHPPAIISHDNRPSMKVRRNQKLWESDQLMEMFFAYSVEGIWFMEAEEPFEWNDNVDKEEMLDYALAHQHIVRVNQAMLDQYDARLDDLMGVTLNDFFAHDLERARKMWGQVFDSGQLTCETCERKYRGPNKFAGEPVWFLGDYFCIYNSEGKMVGHFGAQRDITARKKAEQALMESEERYRYIAKNVADGIALIQDGRLLVVNDAFVKMFGCKHERQIMGHDFSTMISRDYVQQFEAFTAEIASQTINVQSHENRGQVFQGIFLSTEGRDFWAEGQFTNIMWQSQPALFCTIRDIHDQKLKEIAAQERTKDLYIENIRLRSSIKERYRFCDIIGKSPDMQQVYELVIRAAHSDANVCIYGESGTGKELVAHAIHDLSRRSEKKFVVVNCNAIPENLMESEFFGHKKGSFTGADRDKPGFLEIANHGDLFLDEIGDISLSLQGKLMRAIETGEYSPVGQQTTCRSDFRVIAATNKDMANAVRNGTIREDFFFRIHIIAITIPPLRERKEDIPLLIDHFMASIGSDESYRSIPGQFMEAMYKYSWPGNVRELRNVLHRYVTMGDMSILEYGKNQQERLDRTASIMQDQNEVELSDFKESVESYEKTLILSALNQTNWNRQKTCQALHIPRRTLYYKMKRYGLI